MNKYARLTEASANGDRTVIEVVDGQPGDRFHPSIASQFISAPAAAVPGSVKNGQTWTHPTPPEPVEPAREPRRLQVSPVEFKMMFTSAERIAIRTARDADDVVLDDWFGIIDDPRLTMVDLSLPQTLEGLDYLVDQEILTEQRRDEIAAGLPA